MALTPEQIDRLIQQADGLAPKEGSIFRALVKLTEAEVRKQNDALIQQLVAAIDDMRLAAAYTTYGAPNWDDLEPALAAARASLKDAP